MSLLWSDDQGLQNRKKEDKSTIACLDNDISDNTFYLYRGFQDT